MFKRSTFVLGAVAGTAFGFALAQHGIAPAAAAVPAAPTAVPAAPAAGAAPATPAPAATAGASVREFKILGTDYRGTKRWEPGTLICYQGETVRITLINKIPAEPPTHGFTIAAFNVKEEIAANQEKTIEFVADKAGLFTINCHLHPKHIGGQLLVLAK